MEFKDVIAARRSRREYLDRAVEVEKVKEIMKAGTLAPTGMDKQNLRFVAVLNKAALSDIRKNTFGGDDLFYSAPAVVFCIETEETSTTELNVGAAMENMALAATDLGLGCCWIHCARERLNADAARLSDILHLSAGEKFLECLTLGYSAQKREPKEVRETITVIK